MYVLDSSALIEVLEGHPKAEKIMELYGNAKLVTTSLCAHEILAGALSKKDRFVLEGVFSSMRILDHTMRAARVGAAMQQELSQAGTMINKFDVLIASICKLNDGELVTLDKDFAKIKNFRAIVL